MLGYSVNDDKWSQLQSPNPPNYTDPTGVGKRAVWDSVNERAILVGGTTNNAPPGNTTFFVDIKTIVSGKSIAFQVDDPKDQPFFIMTNKTDLTGNATVSFTLPLDAPEGTYHCTATANVSGEILYATTKFEVRWPWSPVFNLDSSIIQTHEYESGESIGLNAYAGYEYTPAAGIKPAPNESLIANVYYPNQTYWMNITRNTDAFGKSNLSFTLGNISTTGTYSISVSGFKGFMKNTTFFARAPDIIPIFRFNSVTSPASVNRGAAFTINVVIENTYPTNQNCLLVVQILDSNNVPIRPIIQKLNVTVTPAFLANVTVTFDLKAPVGQYDIQVQLLTGLPKDHGYALDFRNGTILVN
jgi:hypothetical protein